MSGPRPQATHTVLAIGAKSLCIYAPAVFKIPIDPKSAASLTRPLVLRFTATLDTQAELDAQRVLFPVIVDGSLTGGWRFILHLRSQPILNGRGRLPRL